MSSYVVIDRDLARNAVRVARWLVPFLADAGYRAHEADLRLFCAQIEDAIDASQRRSDLVRREVA